MVGFRAHSRVVAVISSILVLAIYSRAVAQTPRPPASPRRTRSPGATVPVTTALASAELQPEVETSLESRIAALEQQLAAHNESPDARLGQVLQENVSLSQQLHSLALDYEFLAQQYEEQQRLVGKPALTAYYGSSWEQNQPSDILTDEPLPKRSEKQPTKGTFFEGFKWETVDGEYQLQFHNETQLDIPVSSGVKSGQKATFGAKQRQSGGYQPAALRPPPHDS